MQRMCYVLWSNRFEASGCRGSMSHAGTLYIKPMKDPSYGGEGFKHNVKRLIQGHQLSDLNAFQQKLIGQPAAECYVAVHYPDFGHLWFIEFRILICYLWNGGILSPT